MGVSPDCDYISTPVDPHASACPVPEDGMVHALTGMAKQNTDLMAVGVPPNRLRQETHSCLSRHFPAISEHELVNGHGLITVNDRYAMSFPDYTDRPPSMVQAWLLEGPPLHTDGSHGRSLMDLAQDGTLASLPVGDCDVSRVAAAGLVYGLRPLHGPDRDGRDFQHVVSMTPTVDRAWRATLLPTRPLDVNDTISHTEHRGPFGWWEAALQAVDNGLDTTAMQATRIHPSKF